MLSDKFSQTGIAFCKDPAIKQDYRTVFLFADQFTIVEEEEQVIPEPEPEIETKPE